MEKSYPRVQAASVQLTVSMTVSLWSPVASLTIQDPDDREQGLNVANLNAASVNASIEH